MHNRHGVRGHVGATKLVTIGGVAVKSSQRVTPWDQAARGARWQRGLLFLETINTPACWQPLSVN